MADEYTNNFVYRPDPYFFPRDDVNLATRLAAPAPTEERALGRLSLL